MYQLLFHMNQNYPLLTIIDVRPNYNLFVLTKPSYRYKNLQVDYLIIEWQYIFLQLPLPILKLCRLASILPLYNTMKGLTKNKIVN